MMIAHKGNGRQKHKQLAAILADDQSRAASTPLSPTALHSMRSIYAIRWIGMSVAP
jgi:hypothetical protein